MNSTCALYKVSQEGNSTVEGTSFSCVQKHIAQLTIEARPLCTIGEGCTFTRNKSLKVETSLNEEELEYGENRARVKLFPDCEPGPFVPPPSQANPYSCTYYCAPL